MKSGILLLGAFLLLLSNTACSTQEEDEPLATGSLHLRVHHAAGKDSLVLNNTFYKNAVGNELRFTKLKYFISGLQFYRKGKKVYEQPTPLLVHAAYPENNQFFIENIPSGSYDTLQLSIGVIRQYNYNGAIKLLPDNFGMYWPEELGGGYHFMKLEGHWQHDTAYGTFAFHLGQSENLITGRLPFTAEVLTGQTQNWVLQMDVLEWFERPYTYDLRYEDGYTMANGPQMKILQKNGYSTLSLYCVSNCKMKRP